MAKKSLNPCCSGYYALRKETEALRFLCIQGLNPCCSGYYALSLGGGVFYFFKKGSQSLL